LRDTAENWSLGLKATIMQDQRFHYRRISRKLLIEFSDTLRAGKSFAFLGPAFGGRTLLMNHLSGLLTDVRRFKVQFESDTPARDAAEVYRRLAIATSKGDDTPSTWDGVSMLSPLTEIASKTDQPICLMVSGLDGIVYPVLRQLLIELKREIDNRRIILVASAGGLLSDLISGHGSVLEMPDIFMLQGFEEAEFQEFVVENYVQRAATLSISVDQTGREALWNVTGGSNSLVGWIFWVIFERLFNTQDRHTSRPIGEAEVKSLAKEIALRGVRGAHTLMRADRIISREPTSWPMLELLAKYHSCELNDSDPPHPLEFAGVAIRSDGRLVPASPIMETFIESYYDETRIADMNAQGGYWDEAFRRYAKLIASQRLRPLHPGDHRELASCVSAFRPYMFTKAGDIPALLSLFARGCCYILGFSDITFWQWCGMEEGWTLDRLASISADFGDLEQTRLLLPQDPNSVSRDPYVPLDLGNSVVAGLMPSLREDRPLAWIVTDHNANQPSAPERRQLLLRLAEDLERAHKTALENEQEKLRGERQRAYGKTIGQVLSAVARNESGVHGVLEASAKTLRTLPYKRILISLVDRQRQRIKGAADISDDSTVKIDALTDWPLHLSNRDLQPWVVANRRSLRIPDARHEPLANKKVVEVAHLLSMAVVPIFEPHTQSDKREVIGTIHIERRDNTVPSSEETKELESFADHLGSAITVARRVAILRAALRQLPGPLMLIDPRENVRFRNPSAKRVFRIAETTVGDDEPKVQGLPPLIQQRYRACLNGNRVVFNWTTAPTSDDFEGQVTCDAIIAKDNTLLATMVCGQDASFQHKLVSSFTSLVECHTIDDFLTQVLSIGRTLDRPWMRIYRVDTEKPDDFSCFGCFDRRLPEVEQRFKSGKIALPSRTLPGTEAWQVFDRHAPLIFCFDTNSANGSEVLVNDSLSVITITRPHSYKELGKTVGDWWLDVPLFAPDGTPVAKISISWSENAPSAEYEFYKMLIELFPRLLWRNNCSKLIG
jgi:PAS domain-containing protein